MRVFSLTENVPERCFIIDSLRVCRSKFVDLSGAAARRSSMQCPRCHSETPPDTEFCPECGARAAVICTGCSTINALAHKFCAECGQRMTGTKVGNSASF